MPKLNTRLKIYNIWLFVKIVKNVYIILNLKFLTFISKLLALNLKYIAKKHKI